MTNDKYCAINCPYLKRCGEEEKLPYYCELFKVFLSTELKNVIRADGCDGKKIDAITSGYNLISSYTNKNIDKQKTKWGFKHLHPQLQTQFVEILQKKGIEIGIPAHMPMHENMIIDTLISQIKENQIENAYHQETNQFDMILSKLGDDFPSFLNSSDKQILSNLFLVLDVSEQDMLTNILSNKESAESFLKTFDSMPKTENLVKDLRRHLDDLKNQNEDEDRRRSLEAFKLMQQEIQRQIQLQKQRQEELERQQKQKLISDTLDKIKTDQEQRQQKEAQKIIEVIKQQEQAEKTEKEKKETEMKNPEKTSIIKKQMEQKLGER